MTGPADKPAAEVEVSVELVRALLADQHPDLAGRTLRPLAAGWDNVLVRVGDDLVARLPRRAAAADLVAAEQRWLPVLAPRWPLPVPVPVRVGHPGPGYPWRWSILPFLPGRTALRRPPTDPVAAAVSLAAFVAAVGVPAPPDAPANAHRGVPLADRDARTRAWIDQAADQLSEPAAVVRCWADHVDLPRWAGTPRWLHGDLHPDNVLVHRGVVSAVLDLGDLTAGDPATDLIVAWMLLAGAARDAFRELVAVDDATWARGRGWALTIGLAFLTHSADDPDYARVGRATVDAVLADA